MNGYLLEQFGKPYVYHSDIAVPTPGPGMLLVRTKVAGYCHTDLAAMSVRPLYPFLYVHSLNCLREDILPHFPLYRDMKTSAL